jgi:hypothetical protein
VESFSRVRSEWGFKRLNPTQLRAVLGIRLDQSFGTQRVTSPSVESRRAFLYLWLPPGSVKASDPRL